MKKIVTALSLALLVSSCGGGGKGKGKGGGEEGSNIQYLKTNHNSYSQLNSSEKPAPEKSESALSIQWGITAKTEEEAEKLYDHINFMIDKLEAGKTPRGWDKLFLLEAYMKTAFRYTTDLSREGVTKVLIKKIATDRCSYEVISAHSDAVRGDFFGQGVIDTDYSSIAEGIINSSYCSDSKTKLEQYVKDNQKTKGK